MDVLSVFNLIKATDRAARLIQITGVVLPLIGRLIRPSNLVGEFMKDLDGLLDLGFDDVQLGTGSAEASFDEPLAGEDDELLDDRF